MTTKKYHWFPFYYLDWMTDLNVQMLSHAEKGLYIDMLCSCFNEDGLPTDHTMLQRLFKCDADDLKMVVTLFHERDGKLHNKKLDEVKADQQSKSQQASDAGKKSAQARKAKALTEATDVQRTFNENPTNRVEKSRVEESKDNTPLVEEVWSNTPKMGRARSSKAKLKSALSKTTANRDQIMMGLRAWVNSAEWKKDGGQFVQGIHIWAKDCKWENPPPQPPNNLLSNIL